MNRKGSTHLLSFWAFKGCQPGTLCVVVGQAQAPHRMMFNQGHYSQAVWDAGESMSTTGETHKIEFWPLASPELGAIRIAVGEAWSPHRIMINHDSKSQAELDAGASMSTARLTYKVEFWAPSTTPGWRARTEGYGAGVRSWHGGCNRRELTDLTG